MMSKIKMPVTVQLAGSTSVNVRDSNGNLVAICRGDLIDDTFYPPGYFATQIAEALNRTADLKAKLANQREFLKYVAGQSKEALAIIEREGFVFDHSVGRWEKLAFTLYSDLVAISSEARHQLEEIEENNDEQ